MKDRVIAEIVRDLKAEVLKPEVVESLEPQSLKHLIELFDELERVLEKRNYDLALRRVGEIIAIAEPVINLITEVLARANGQ